MDRWEGRVALVTGASRGIGAAICEALVCAGMKVVGAARGKDKIEILADKLKGEKGSLIAVKCDLTNDEDIHAVFKLIKETYGGVDVCINNAGIMTTDEPKLLESTTKGWRNIMDVNVIALCLCTKLAVASMRERGVDDGHIINTASICSHVVLPVFHFYTATKFAVRAIAEGIRQELRDAKSHIRISNISPGFVNTDLLKDNVRSAGVESRLESLRIMDPQDIARSVLHILTAPPHVEINDLIIRAVEQFD